MRAKRWLGLTCRALTRAIEAEMSARIEHGRLDVLVQNVGAVRIRVDGFLAKSDDEFEWALQMNFITGLRDQRAS